MTKHRIGACEQRRVAREALLEREKELMCSNDELVGAWDSDDGPRARRRSVIGCLAHAAAVGPRFLSWAASPGV